MDDILLGIDRHKLEVSLRRLNELNRLRILVANADNTIDNLLKQIEQLYRENEALRECIAELEEECG